MSTVWDCSDDHNRTSAADNRASGDGGDAVEMGRAQRRSCLGAFVAAHRKNREVDWIERYRRCMSVILLLTPPTSTATQYRHTGSERGRTPRCAGRTEHAERTFRRASEAEVKIERK